jgi:hypothetical protein
VRFNLLTTHTNKDSMNHQRRKHRNNNDKTVRVRPTLPDICQGVLTGSIPLAVSDTAATSSTFLPSALTLPTATISTTMFHLPNAATMINKLHHNLQEPARSVNIVPSLVSNSILSTVKMVEAVYTAIYDDKEFNFCDSTTTKNHSIGRCYPQRVVMPMGQTVVCPSCGEHPK